MAMTTCPADQPIPHRIIGTAMVYGTVPWLHFLRRKSYCSRRVVAITREEAVERATRWAIKYHGMRVARVKAEDWEVE